MTEVAHREGLEAIQWCGGVYSSEWSFSKLLHWLRAEQTGLLRFTWDNGNRTVLVNPNLRGVTLGWNLQSTTQDELFAAIEGTAFHTRVILENGGTRRSHQACHQCGRHFVEEQLLNQVYANVLGRRRYWFRVSRL